VTACSPKKIPSSFVLQLPFLSHFFSSSGGQELLVFVTVVKASLSYIDEIEMIFLENLKNNHISQKVS
jgi:hypothetical protein